MDSILKRLLSPRFIAAEVAALWYLVAGTFSEPVEAMGWKVVAIILGYIVVEGGRDLIIAYWTNQKGSE